MAREAAEEVASGLGDAAELPPLLDDADLGLVDLLRGQWRRLVSEEAAERSGAGWSAKRQQSGAERAERGELAERRTDSSEPEREREPEPEPESSIRSSRAQQLSVEVRRAMPTRVCALHAGAACEEGWAGTHRTDEAHVVG